MSTHPDKTNLKSPPPMRPDMTYEDWKKDIEFWSDITTIEAKKQGGSVFFVLQGKAKETVRAGVTREEMKAEDGLTKVLAALDALYLKDASTSSYSAYENFSRYRRPANVTISDYLLEFNIKYSKLKSYKMTLPDGVLAYYVLKCANLTEEQTNLCKATCSEMKLDPMIAQIKKVTSDAGKCDKPSQDITVQSQFYTAQSELYTGAEAGYDNEYPYYEEEYEAEADEGEGAEFDTYYAQQRHPGPQYQYRSRARRGGPWSQRGGATPPGPRLNAPDEYGNPTCCSFCGSTYHYVSKCPDAVKQAAARGRGTPTLRRPARRGSSGGRGGYI